MAIFMQCGRFTVIEDVQSDGEKVYSVTCFDDYEIEREIAIDCLDQDAAVRIATALDAGAASIGVECPTCA